VTKTLAGDGGGMYVGSGLSGRHTGGARASRQAYLDGRTEPGAGTEMLDVQD
jgi:hypothetical protein